MLTAAQKARCAELAAALDRGGDGPYLRVEPSITSEERMAIWNARTNFAVWAERGRRMAGERSRQRQAEVTAGRQAVQTLARAGDLKPRRIETEFRDLDYWGDDPSPDDGDEDDPEEQQTKLCPVCRGSGRQKDGSQCSECDGSGRVPLDDVDDDDDEDEYDREKD